MATYKFTFSRRVVSHDEFEREIEADTPEKAQALADEIANASNHDCPDDAAPSDYAEFDDWEAAPTVEI